MQSSWPQRPLQSRKTLKPSATEGGGTSSAIECRRAKFKLLWLADQLLRKIEVVVRDIGQCLLPWSNYGGAFSQAIPRIKRFHREAPVAHDQEHSILCISYCSG